jgi:predicted dehydrogenase
MTPPPLRVAFAGLAHSHPHTDAMNARALGAEVVGVHDADAAAGSAFAARFGGSAVGTVAELAGLRPDLVIATPLPHEVDHFLLALGAGVAPVFVNKVIAATGEQLAEVERAVSTSSVPVGTSSVLRFAPAVVALAAEVALDEVLGIRVHAQHDNAAFQLADRSWQDDPQRGGGTLVTVGVHAWEMLDAVLPGATLVAGSGWARVRQGSATASEDAAGVDGRLRLPGVPHEVPVQLLVTGTPGADAYRVDVVTAAGIQSVSLGGDDGDDANETLGFRGLIRALLDAAVRGSTVAPWSSARVVVANTIRAAEIARGEP